MTRRKTNPAGREGARETTVGRVLPLVLEYTAGRDRELDRQLVEVDCLGTAAHVRMLSRLPVRPPIFTAAESRRVIRELERIRREARAGRFEITLEDQDVHLAVERVLTERLGELGRRVHTGRSRNDQVAVDLRLYAKLRLLDLIDHTASLGLTLCEFGRRHEWMPMVGRTHQQPAMPSSVGLWAAAYAESVVDDLEGLRAAYRVNNRCPLGAAAGYGVPLPIDRELTARLLGFERPTWTTLHGIQARGKVEGVILAAAAQAMLTCARLSQDLILYSMPEFGYFSLPEAFCTGSSIMPQKRNPDVLELVRARSARVAAEAHLVNEIVRAAPGGYNRDLQETKEPFLDGLSMTDCTLVILTSLCANLGVNPERLRAAFAPEVFATDRALELTLSGLPFRDAYRRVREELPTLAGRDPDEAIRARRHVGAPAGVPWDRLEGAIREMARFADAERRAFERTVEKLMNPEERT